MPADAGCKPDARRPRKGNPTGQRGTPPPFLPNCQTSTPRRSEPAKKAGCCPAGGPSAIGVPKVYFVHYHAVEIGAIYVRLACGRTIRTQMPGIGTHRQGGMPHHWAGISVGRSAGCREYGQRLVPPCCRQWLAAVTGVLPECVLALSFSCCQDHMPIGICDTHMAQVFSHALSRKSFD